MKLERDKANQRFIKLKHQEDIKTSKDISLLLEITKNNSAKLDKLDDDLNSNPFTILFKTKGKEFGKYLLSFVFAIISMIGIYLLWIKWIYDWRFTSENFVEILGNGFFWLVAGIIYWFWSKTIMFFIERIKFKNIWKKIAVKKR